MADERAVKEALDRSSEAIRVGQLQSLLRVQVELTDQAEQEARAVKVELLRLLEAVAPDQAEADLAAGPPLESLSAKELVSLLQSRLRGVRSEPGGLSGKPGGRGAGAPAKEYATLRGELAGAKAELASFRSEAERLQRELNASREQNRFLLGERKRLLEKGARLEGAPGESIEQEGEEAGSGLGEAGKEGIEEDDLLRDPPQWLGDWQKEETFETDKRLLLLLGETGLSRRPVVESALARELGIKQTTRTIRSRLARLQDEGLIEIFRPWKEASLPICSRLPDLVKLTEKGRQAFGALTGRVPRDPDIEALAAKYSSPEKALLVLAAADVLSASGYVKVEHGSGDVPAPADLVAEDRDGQAVSIAVVRDDPQDASPGKGEGRWPVLDELTRGNLYVVCDGRACMYKIRNQINHALGTRPCSIHLTNLVDLQAGKRGEGGSIWLEAKTRPSTRQTSAV